jgi:hypothetical protein
MNEELTRKQDPDEGQEALRGEEREAALPSGRAGGRRGETARQLIRRAKQANASGTPQCVTTETSLAKSHRQVQR